jgi:hypothetical protein
MNWNIMLQTTETSTSDFWAFLRDAGWWQVILAIVALIVGYIFFRAQTQRKNLSYKILSSRPLFQTERDVKQKFEINFEGQPVNDLHLLIIQIYNSGNIPITKSDYEREVRLIFKPNNIILTAEITESIPANLGASLQIVKTVEPVDAVEQNFIHKHHIEFSQILLNKGDLMTAEILLNHYEGGIIVDGRIVGVKEIRQAMDSYWKRMELISEMASIVIASLLTPLVSIPLYFLLNGNLDFSMFNPLWLISNLTYVPDYAVFLSLYGFVRLGLSRFRQYTKRKLTALS